MVKKVRYFIKKDNNQLGPFTIDELKELLDAGNIKLTDLASPEGSNHYLPLSSLDLFPPPAAKNDQKFKKTLPQYLKGETVSLEITPRKSGKSLIEIIIDTARSAGSISIFFLLIAPIKSILFFHINIKYEYLFADNITNIIFSNQQDLIIVGVIGIITAYVLITSIVMTILSSALDVQDLGFSFGELFWVTQRKIPKFLFALMIFGLIFNIIHLSTSLCPSTIRPTAEILGLLLFLYFVIRFFPLPFMLVLDKKGLIESIKSSYLITHKNIWRVIGAFILFAFIGTMTIWSQCYEILLTSYETTVTFIAFLIVDPIFCFFTHLHLDLVSRAEDAGIIPVSHDLDS